MSPAMLHVQHAIHSLASPGDDSSSDTSNDPIGAIVETIDDSDVDGWDLGTAGIILAVTVVVSRVAKLGLERGLGRRIDPALATLIGRVVGYLIILFGLIYSLERLGIAVLPILGALGIVGIALAFAFQDILENFIAGVLLQLQRPFTYGDQVYIHEHEGTIESIDSRTVTIITPAGETIKIPSATVIKSDINNYTTRGQRRSTVPVGVAYGSDLAEVERVLTEAVTGADGVREMPPPEVYFTGFGDSSIDFDVRYWHEPSIATFWAVRHAVGIRIDRALADAGITIPFPQRTLWYGGETDD